MKIIPLNITTDFKWGFWNCYSTEWNFKHKPVEWGAIASSASPRLGNFRNFM